MNRLLILLIPLMLACGGQFKKGGIIDKKELRSKKPPSVKIAEGYDKKAKKVKTYKNPKKAEKARLKEQEKIRKRGRKYLKKKNAGH